MNRGSHLVAGGHGDSHRHHAQAQALADGQGLQALGQAQGRALRQALERALRQALGQPLGRAMGRAMGRALMVPMARALEQAV